VGPLNDMDIESVGFSDKACFGRGRRESGVRWCDNDVETTPDKAR